MKKDLISKDSKVFGSKYYFYKLTETILRRYVVQSQGYKKISLITIRLLKLLKIYQYINNYDNYICYHENFISS